MGKGVNVELRFLNLGKGVIIPFVMRKGYITLDRYGYLEMWARRPFYVESGSWDHKKDISIDLATIDPYLFKHYEIETMLFDHTGKKLL